MCLLSRGKHCSYEDPTWQWIHQQFPDCSGTWGSRTCCPALGRLPQSWQQSWAFSGWHAFQKQMVLQCWLTAKMKYFIQTQLRFFVVSWEDCMDGCFRSCLIASSLVNRLVIAVATLMSILDALVPSWASGYPNRLNSFIVSVTPEGSGSFPCWPEASPAQQPGQVRVGGVWSVEKTIHIYRKTWNISIKQNPPYGKLLKNAKPLSATCKLQLSCD